MPGYGDQFYPLTYGGQDSVEEIELQAMLDSLAPGWDASPGTPHYAEVQAHAIAVAMIWALNDRLRAQALPSEMQEALPDWEKILILPPLAEDTLVERRAVVAAKLRGLASNALGDIYDAAAALGGASFLGLAQPTLSQVVAYLSGINPGPPGREWSSNQASVTVELSRGSIDDKAFATLLRRLRETLEAMIPGWMTFLVGTVQGGLVVGVGTVGLTIL